MGFEVDEKWLREYEKRTGIKVHRFDNGTDAQGTEKRRSKYGNVKTEIDGRTYDSKHEAQRHSELMIMAKGREIVGFAEQVGIRLPGDAKYVADFVVLQRDGTFRIEDAKSDATRKDKVYRLKKKLVKEEYGIDITEV